jgi:hypothetical protein
MKTFPQSGAIIQHFWNISSCCPVVHVVVVSLRLLSSSHHSLEPGKQSFNGHKQLSGGRGRRCRRRLPEICLNRNHDEDKKERNGAKAIRFCLHSTTDDDVRIVVITSLCSLLLPRMMIFSGAEAAAAVSARSSRPPTSGRPLCVTSSAHHHPSQKEITDDSPL